MKKAIYFAYLYHAICFISMLFAQFKKSARMVLIFKFGDVIGIFAFPLLIAVVAMVLSFRDQKRVLIQYPQAAVATGIIDLIRCIVGGIMSFSVSVKAGFLSAMVYLVVSFLLLSMWFLIFEISSKFMNGGTKFTKKKKRK